jgi:hypothetical protein
MLNNKVKAHGGFTPAGGAPLNVITPEKVIHYHRTKQR